MRIGLPALFFLLLTFTNAEYVYDTHGDRLSKAHSYYIAIGSGYGRSYLTLPNVGKQSCPLPVKVSPISPENHLFPVKFLNHNIYPFAAIDMPLNFTFVDTPLCTKLSKWFVVMCIPLGSSLMFGHAGGSPDWKGDFYIKNYGEKSYKIIFCLERSSETCGDLYLRKGQYLEDTFGEEVIPLPIRFEKVGSGISLLSKC